MTKFIVLSGRKQAGKTTAANYLLKKVFGQDIKITSFASPIKDFCTSVVGLTEAQVYGSDEDKNSPTHILWDNMPLEIRLQYGTVSKGVNFPSKNLPFIEVKGCRYRFRNTGWSHNMSIPEDDKRGPMTAREVMQIFGTDIMRNFFDYDVWSKAPFQKYSNSDWDVVIIDDCRFPNEADMALENNAVLIRLERDVLGEDVHVSEKALDGYNKYHYTIDNSNMTIEKMYESLDSIMMLEGI